MKLLFICTHNRCRSLLAEAITRQLAGDQILVASAGSQPADSPHPLTLKYLDEAGYDTTGLNSKSWDDLTDFQPDILVTVCDSAAGEACPVWLGPTPKVHWGLPDPSRVEGSDSEQKAAFERVIHIIESRIQALLDANILDKPITDIADFMRQQGGTH